MMIMHSNDRDEITEAFSGDIIALGGLKDTTTGDTLCAQSDPVVLETMTFPDPVIEIAVEPKTKADQEKMGIALQRLSAEDPSFRVETDIESGQTIMKGMGELHLDILVDRMRREFKVKRILVPLRSLIVKRSRMKRKLRIRTRNNLGDLASTPKLRW